MSKPFQPPGWGFKVSFESFLYSTIYLRLIFSDANQTSKIRKKARYCARMEDGRRSREVALLLFLGDLAHTSSHQINKMEKSTSLDDIRQCENKHANRDEMPVLTQSPDDDDDVPDLVPENQLHWDEQLTLRESMSSPFYCSSNQWN
jgi:hypothetical protein